MHFACFFIGSFLFFVHFKVCTAKTAANALYIFSIPRASSVSPQLSPAAFLSDFAHLFRGFPAYAFGYDKRLLSCQMPDFKHRKNAWFAQPRIFSVLPSVFHFMNVVFRDILLNCHIDCFVYTILCIYINFTFTCSIGPNQTF